MADKYDRFQVADIDPIVIVRKLIAKARRDNMREEQSIELSLIDFYPAYMTMDLLEAELSGLEFEVFDSLTEQLSSVMSSVLKTEVAPHMSTMSAIAYYNTFLEKKLEFLRKGGRYFPTTDETGNAPIITDYTITHTDGLKTFTVRFQLAILIEAVKQFIADYDRLQGKMHQLWESAIESNAPSIIKQGQLFMEQVARMQKLLGLDKVNSLNCGTTYPKKVTMGLLKKVRLSCRCAPCNNRRCIFMSLRAIQRIARQSQLPLWDFFNSPTAPSVSQRAILLAGEHLPHLR